MAGLVISLTLFSGSSERPITTSRSPNFLCNAFSSGIALRHGPHQVAQKSMSTNLPFRSGSFVSHFSTTRVGAFWLSNELAQSFFSAPKDAETENTQSSASEMVLFMIVTDRGLLAIGQGKSQAVWSPAFRRFGYSTA